MDYSRVPEKVNNRRCVILINDQLPIFIYTSCKSAKKENITRAEMVVHEFNHVPVSAQEFPISRKE